MSDSLTRAMRSPLGNGATAGAVGFALGAVLDILEKLQ